MQKVIVLTISIFLLLAQGCSSTPIQVRNPFVMPETEEIIHHPEFPEPIPPFMKGRIKSVQYRNEDGTVSTILGFSPDDSQLFRLWEEQKELRVKKLTNMVCFYREQLEAPESSFCPTKDKEDETGN